MTSDLELALTQRGIQRPAMVIEVATRVGLELAVACVILEKESAGGRNVWGHDPVPTDGAYTKGGPVTETNYRAYRRSLAQGRAGAQGVGPCQLTWRGYQDAADEAGGCWSPRANMTIGFQAIRDLQRAHGVRKGFRAYNGSGPAAERYAAAAMVLLARWRERLGSASVTGRHAAVKLGDTGDEVRALQTFARQVFPDYAPTVVDGVYGEDTRRFVAEFQRRVGITGPDADGRIVGPKTLAALARFGY
jgi:hypothetical protein